MKAANVKLDAFVYSSAINACAKDRGRGGPPDGIEGKSWARKGMELLEEMEESGVEPNNHAYASAISACGNHGGDWKMGVDILGTMKERGMEVGLVAYNSAMGAIVKRMRGSVRREWEEGGEEGKEENDMLWRKTVGLLEEIKNSDR